MAKVQPKNRRPKYTKPGAIKHYNSLTDIGKKRVLYKALAAGMTKKQAYNDYINRTALKTRG